jgi:hypothetical protein
MANELKKAGLPEPDLVWRELRAIETAYHALSPLTRTERWSALLYLCKRLLPPLLLKNRETPSQRREVEELRTLARLAWNNWPDSTDARRVLAEQERKALAATEAWDRVVEAIRSRPVPAAAAEEPSSEGDINHLPHHEDVPPETEG